MQETKHQRESQRGDDIIAGRNAVQEALRSGRTIDSLYVARGNHTGSLAALIAKAKEQGVAIKEADARKLDFLCGNANHQGVVAVAAVKEYASVEDMFTLAQQRGEAPFIILADELEDPHNLGAILRTAECAGAHGVIIPRRRSVGLTYAVGKASAGAVEYVPVARVTNMAAAVEELKERGVWVYAADLDGETWCGVDYSGPVALVIGNEGHGVSRLVKEKSDFVVTLPMAGQISSLNASVACGILCYEVARQRQGLRAR
ncbi:MAG: 23S rRNA (guanosine(2251)-2'-O)-methyltransferase RlmB [Clostridiales bacterium]|jgi:23S rRNA (guanosine2251-2'-O)-methyltransferase|nr:23S rRNA (guanosine(2251)-2'-O)-methyltransferase RlmB [Clostridiales bacterium]